MPNTDRASTPSPRGDSIPHPPLFTRLWSDKGAYTFIAERDLVMDLDLASDWYCEAKAPGGESAQGMLAAGGRGTVDEVYHRILALFGTDDPAKLWFTPVRPLALKDLKTADIKIGVWDASGLPLPEDGFAVHGDARHPYGLLVEVKGHSASYVETPDREGRPAFAALRGGDLLVFDAVEGSGRDELFPRVYSRPGYHTAYWSFARAELHEAAHAVAKKLLADTASDRPQSEEELLAAAHAMLRFREFWGAEPSVSRRLTGMERSFDANLTRWVISYENGEENAFDDLPALLARFEGEKPAFAETFRLFYSRLRPAVIRAKVSETLRAELERSEQLVDRLAASSYLSGEHLIFRGRSPLDPDPAAETTTAPAQKKTFPHRSKQAFRRASGH